MSSKVTKVIRLSRSACRKSVTQPKEAWLLLRMAWWVSVLSAAAKLCPLPRALEIVSGRGNPNTRDFDPDLPARLARSMDTLLSVGLLHFTPVCWKRAAVLRRYLSRNGIATMIQFGVRADQVGKVDGHAWLELDGKPFLETAPAEYVVTYSFPSEKSYRAEEALLSSD